MPLANHFRHQTYTSAAPPAPYFMLRPGGQPSLNSDEFRQRTRLVGDRFRENGVAAIYLIHGTFAGTGPLGLIESVSGILPGVATVLRRLVKRTVDGLLQDLGNFPEAYRRLFEECLTSESAPVIPVRRFFWTGENHHLGRAHAAVRLIDELSRGTWTDNQRVLLWGHSHGGNILALLTNLLAADELTRDKFFLAAEPYAGPFGGGGQDVSMWERVRRLLAKRDHPLFRVKFDLVTLGTPIRYGWDTTGCQHLLHFVHHRPEARLPEYLSRFPWRPGDVVCATSGDFIQHVGIVGTNLPPHPLAWQAWRSDCRFKTLLQSPCRSSGLICHVAAGQRVPADGTTLLVDYLAAGQWLDRSFFGHAVYTRRNWLLFHAEEVARRFYGTVAVTSPDGSTSSTP
ncbi:MAG: hypothetical protein HZA46_15775 [Planctomycetales bacterium]|nr:hypothetical protein [Planctomycetales bacterium]